MSITVALFGCSESQPSDEELVRTLYEKLQNSGGGEYYEEFSYQEEQGTLSEFAAEQRTEADEVCGFSAEEMQQHLSASVEGSTGEFFLDERELAVLSTYCPESVDDYRDSFVEVATTEGADVADLRRAIEQALDSFD